MGRQSWRKSGSTALDTHKKFRDALLNKPEVKIALARYINSLNLQGQIDKGIITENQALALFDKAIKNFTRQLHDGINDSLSKLRSHSALDQTDLSNPLNMQTALNNPNSLASMQMDDLVAAQVTMVSEQIQNEGNNQMQPQVQHIAGELGKTAIIVGALKAIDDLDHTASKKIVEDAFHEITDKKGGSFEHLEKEMEEKENKFQKEFAPKFTPPKDFMEKEKGKG